MAPRSLAHSHSHIQTNTHNERKFGHENVCLRRIYLWLALFCLLGLCSLYASVKKRKNDSVQRKRSCTVFFLYFYFYFRVFFSFFRGLLCTHTHHTKHKIVNNIEFISRRALFLFYVFFFSSELYVFCYCRLLL